MRGSLASAWSFVLAGLFACWCCLLLHSPGGYCFLLFSIISQGSRRIETCDILAWPLQFGCNSDIPRIGGAYNYMRIAREVWRLSSRACAAQAQNLRHEDRRPRPEILTPPPLSPPPPYEDSRDHPRPT